MTVVQLGKSFILHHPYVWHCYQRTDNLISSRSLYAFFRSRVNLLFFIEKKRTDTVDEWGYESSAPVRAFLGAVFIVDIVLLILKVTSNHKYDSERFVQAIVTSNIGTPVYTDTVTFIRINRYVIVAKFIYFVMYKTIFG